MAKKAQKRSATKKAGGTRPKAAPRPAAKAASKAPQKAAPKATAPAKRAGGPSRPAAAPTGLTMLEMAERLRDEIQRSKLTHPDPWVYGAKARRWGERAQALVDQIARGGPATQQDLDQLDTELRGDRDFQEARRLF